jgi:hypothetical protein
MLSSKNYYFYCDNNPTNGIDPMGLFSLNSVGSFLGSAATSFAYGAAILLVGSALLSVAVAGLGAVSILAGAAFIGGAAYLGWTGGQSFGQFANKVRSGEATENDIASAAGTLAGGLALGRFGPGLAAEGERLGHVMCSESLSPKGMHDLNVKAVKSVGGDSMIRRVKKNWWLAPGKGIYYDATKTIELSGWRALRIVGDEELGHLMYERSGSPTLSEAVQEEADIKNRLLSSPNLSISERWLLEQSLAKYIRSLYK